MTETRPRTIDPDVDDPDLCLVWERDDVKLVVYDRADNTMSSSRFSVDFVLAWRGHVLSGPGRHVTALLPAGASVDGFYAILYTLSVTEELVAGHPADVLRRLVNKFRWFHREWQRYRSRPPWECTASRFNVGRDRIVAFVDCGLRVDHDHLNCRACWDRFTRLHRNQFPSWPQVGEADWSDEEDQT